MKMKIVLTIGLTALVVAGAIAAVIVLVVNKEDDGDTQITTILPSTTILSSSTTEEPWQQTCSDHDSIQQSFHLTLTSESRLGLINSMYIQHEKNRLIPFSSSTMLNYLNNEHNVTRRDNFRRHDCNSEYQTGCQVSFKMTPEQQVISNGRATWDRGHLTPSHPFTYSAEANSDTFYCLNIAPQDPYTNQAPWNTLEQRVLGYFADRAGYVITGVCSQDSHESPTNESYPVPDCYWKLVCYLDDDTGETEVVAYIGNNTIVPNGDREAQASRTADTTQARPQQAVLNLLTPDHFQLVTEAWMGAERYLVKNRNETRLPSAESCVYKRDLSVKARTEWNQIMRNAVLTEQIKEDVDLDVERVQRIWSQVDDRNL